VRFSGRPAPPPSDDAIARETDAQLVEAGFWPGDDRYPEPAFFCFAYPKPDGFERAAIPPPGGWNAALGEYLLPYEAARTADDPNAVLQTFLWSTFAAAAELGAWDGALYARR
jgi:hypothetical protein